MRLKRIRESYSRFLTVLKESGVKLNASQKNDLDTFMLALESTMNKQKESTIKATKKIVTEKLEKEYQTVFESFVKHIQQNNELAAKIQNTVTKINESKKMAHKVNDYLNVYVESVLPKKTIVDYDKLKKLETVVESLRDTLLVNDEAVEAKKKALKKRFVSEKKQFETEIAKLQVKLNESMTKSIKLSKKLDSLKAMELLESKTKDLPAYEARQIKKRLAESTAEEIEENFNRILEAVEKEIKENTKTEEVSLEAEVKDIIENGESSADKKAKKEEPKEEPADDEEADEEAETTESDLNESEIDSEQMKLWIKQSLILD